MIRHIIELRENDEIVDEMGSGEIIGLGELSSASLMAIQNGAEVYLKSRRVAGQFAPSACTGCEHHTSES